MNTTQQQAAGIANGTRALTYHDMPPLTPHTDGPTPAGDKMHRGWWADWKTDRQDGPLKPGEVRNLGPVAGTGANPGIAGIGAADLGEVVQLPNGKYVAIFGDSFKGPKMGDGTHYPSVAVPVTFDAAGRPQFGTPLTGPHGPGQLFIPPPQATGTDTLPAGSIRMRDGTTYMMAAGTNALKPTGGSWLVQVTNDPSKGWAPVAGSWRAPEPGMPTQISGYQAADGNVYIAADSFDRSHGVTLYRADPNAVTDRGVNFF